MKLYISGFVGFEKLLGVQVGLIFIVCNYATDIKQKKTKSPLLANL